MDSYNSSQLKLLHTMEYFVVYTNKEHPANANDIISYLEKHGIKAERKSIYRNVDILNRFGVRIIKTRHTFYYESTETDVFHVFAEKIL